MQAITASGLIPATNNRTGASNTRSRRGPVQGITPLPYVLNMDIVEDLLTGRNRSGSNNNNTDQENDSLALQEILLPLLPPDQQNLPNLIEILRSPQLRQAMLSLTGALDTENANIIFSNFNLRPEDGDQEMVRGDAVGALVSAINREAERNRNSTTNNNNNESSSSSSSSMTDDNKKDDPNKK